LKDLYKFEDQETSPWERQEADAVSDFSARHSIISDIRALKPSAVLDLGCGEGYIAASTAGYWESFVGVDHSEKMLLSARNRHLPNAEFALGDIRQPATFANLQGPFDLITSIFSLNYLKVEEARTSIQRAVDLLADDGRIIITHPHPFITFEKNNSEHFSWETVSSYFFSDYWCQGQMNTISGKSLAVGSFHKTFEDLLSIIPSCLLGRSKVEELGFSTREKCPSEFSDLVGRPLHIKLTLSR
jgi:cyclopropane fatty-acyl-phospholipid synthase-like methyltransferase